MVLLLASLVELVVVLDASVVNVALPAIRGDLGFSVRDLTWVVNGYALTFAGLLLLGGRLADLRGRRELLLWGMALFVAASGAGGAAQTPAVLVCARVVQGIGAALLAPASLAIVTAEFPDGAARARAVGVWTAVAVAGGAAGNVLGGLLTATLSWRWVLLVNVPIGAFVIAAARRTLRGVHATPTATRLDVPGAVLATIGVGALCAALVAGLVVGYAVAAVAAGALVLVERRSGAPLVPAALVRRPPIALGNAVLLVAGMALMPMWFFMTLRMQDQLGYSPLQTGLGFLPLAAITVVASIRLAPRLAAHLTPRTQTIVGAIVVAAGFALLAAAPTHAGYVEAILVPSVVVGVGGGVFNPPITSLATDVGDDPHAGAASGLANTSKQLGSVVGLSLLTAITTSERTAFVALGAVALATAALARWLPSRATNVDTR